MEYLWGTGFTVYSMTPGDSVIVYLDPDTQTRAEGAATLLQRVVECEGEYETWFIRFDKEEEIHERRF